MDTLEVWYVVKQSQASALVLQTRQQVTSGTRHHFTQSQCPLHKDKITILGNLSAPPEPLSTLHSAPESDLHPGVAPLPSGFWLGWPIGGSRDAQRGKGEKGWGISAHSPAPSSLGLQRARESALL